jgi:hypothetical protein
MGAMPSEARKWEAEDEARDLDLIDEELAEESRLGDPLGPSIGIITCLIAGAAVWIGVFVALSFR